ncbi:MAG: hypothetical protein HYX97_05370 [Chloroflexi bacterium]|nr:hypothetical protein [Chloroflexota bacterium]
MEDLFSQRYPVRPSPEKLVYDDVPYEVKDRFLNILSEHKRKSPEIFQYWALYGALFQIPEVKQENRFDNAIYQREEQVFCNLLFQLKWFNFLDACQVIIGCLRGAVSKDDTPYQKSKKAKRIEEFVTDLNQLFHNHSLGYKIREYRVERIGSTFVDEGVAGVRVLLQDPRFQGPEGQFQRALEAFYKRPEPDTANAIKDAVGALEAVATIIVNASKSDLDDALNREPIKSAVHGALRDSLRKVYAYRGDAPGASHGQHTPAQPGIEEAEFVVGTCTAAILLLYKKCVSKPEKQ